MNEILTDELIDAIARTRGYIDYPTDSIEYGRIWHTNPKTAPFGKIISKEDFRQKIQRLAYDLSENHDVVHALKAQTIDYSIEQLENLDAIKAQAIEDAIKECTKPITEGMLLNSTPYYNNYNVQKFISELNNYASKLRGNK